MLILQSCARVLLFSAFFVGFWRVPYAIFGAPQSFFPLTSFVQVQSSTFSHPNLHTILQTPYVPSKMPVSFQ
jgi:hypothetical protein